MPFRASPFIGRLLVAVAVLLGCGGCSYQQLRRTLSRRKAVWARHMAGAEVRQGREIVPGSGHVLFYTRLKINPYVGSHNREYTQVYLHVRRLADLPLGQPVAVADSALTISGFVARSWPFDMMDLSGTVTRLSADTLSPTLRLRLKYTVGKRRTLRRQLVFQADTAYFQRKK